MSQKTNRFPGHLMVANPNNPDDEIGRSVILLVEYGRDMAVGLQINRIGKDPNLQSISESLGITMHGDDPVFFGGGMVNSKVHVIHSTDWTGINTTKLNSKLAVTNDISILAALSRDEGPEYYRAVSGHWTWSTKELDHSLGMSTDDTIIVRHKFELVPATVDLVFGYEDDDQWRACIEAAMEHQVNKYFNLSLG